MIDIDKITSVSWKVTWISFLVGLFTFLLMMLFGINSFPSSSSGMKSFGSKEVILVTLCYGGFAVSSMAFTILILAVIANLMGSLISLIIGVKNSKTA